MSFASKYSHATPLFNVRIKEPAYTSLADLFAEYGKDHVFPIAAIYINAKGMYGPQAVIAINESTLVNLPSHLLKVCRDMTGDPEAVTAINEGHAGFKIYQYTGKNGHCGFSVDWVDIQ